MERGVISSQIEITAQSLEISTRSLLCRQFSDIIEKVKRTSNSNLKTSFWIKEQDNQLTANKSRALYNIVLTL